MTIVRWIRSFPQIWLFALVGGMAASVHFLCVILFVEYFSKPELIANIYAFLVAFCFSFLGQRYLTFSQSNQEFLYSLGRYFLISVASFLFNEFLFYLAIYHLHISYLIAFPIIVLIVAVGTFLVSKYWAFH